MKKIFTNLLTVVCVLYALSILIFMPYFNWQYAKENGFLKWLILGEVVPTAQALIWPYYVFFNQPSQNIGKIDERTQRMVLGFFAGYDYMSSANQLARILPSSKDPLGDFQKVKTLLNKSKERLSECDKGTLNYIYTGWGDIVFDKLIPGIELQLAGAQPRADRNDLIRGDALLAEFDTWLQKNWNPILVRLNEKYGWKIKK